MISALETTAVDAIAIFPLVPVDHKPSGIKVIWQERPLVTHPAGAVIVLMVVVPVTCTMGDMGAMVEAEAIAAPSVSGIRPGPPTVNCQSPEP